VNYWAMSEYDNAMNYYESCRRIADSLHNRKFLAFAMNNIGMVYQEIGDYSKAMPQFTKALAIMQEIGDTIESAKIISSMGKLHTNLHQYNEAVKNYLTVLNMIDNRNEHKLYLWVLNDLGEVYSLMNQTEKALGYFEKALQIADQRNDQVGKSMIYNNIGNIYLTQHKFADAKTSFQKSADIARQAKARNQLMIAWKSLSDMYSQMGNYKQSLDYYQWFKEMSDSIYNESKMKNIINLQTRYETEAKENEIKLLQKDAELNHLRIHQQNSVRVFLIILLLAVILLTVITYNQLQIKKKANHVLAEQNEVIKQQKVELSEIVEKLQQTNTKLEEQKIEIQQHAKALDEANKMKDRFFSIIAHDLLSPFNSILGYSDLLLKNIRNYDIEKSEQFVERIHLTAKNTLSLLENLLNWAKMQTGRMTYRPEKIDIQSVVQEVIAMLSASAAIKNISLSFYQSTNFECVADENMIKTVLRNLISNAIKFTHQGGRIDVSAILNEDSIEIAVSDSGIGIDQETLDKLFRIDTNVTTAGTENEKGSGLGLILCKEFVEKHGGKIWVESQLNKGSIFSFSVPDGKR